jgi:hypothetical protein
MFFFWCFNYLSLSISSSTKEEKLTVNTIDVDKRLETDMRHIQI